MTVNRCDSCFNPPLSTQEQVATAAIVLIALAAIGCFVLSQALNTPPSLLNTRWAWVYLGGGVALGITIAIYLATRERPSHVSTSFIVPPPRRSAPQPAAVLQPAPEPQKEPKPKKNPPKTLARFTVAKTFDSLPDEALKLCFGFLKFQNMKDLAMTSTHYYGLFTDNDPKKRNNTSKLVTETRDGQLPGIYDKVGRKLLLIAQTRNLPANFTAALQNLPTINDLDKRNFRPDQFLIPLRALQADRPQLQQLGIHLAWCAEIGFFEGVEIFLRDNNDPQERCAAIAAATRGQHLNIIKRLWSENLTYPEVRALWNKNLISAQIKTLWEDLTDDQVKLLSGENWTADEIKKLSSEHLTEEEIDQLTAKDKGRLRHETLIDAIVAKLHNTILTPQHLQRLQGANLTLEQRGQCLQAACAHGHPSIFKTLFESSEYSPANRPAHSRFTYLDWAESMIMTIDAHRQGLFAYLFMLYKNQINSMPNPPRYIQIFPLVFKAGVRQGMTGVVKAILAHIKQEQVALLERHQKERAEDPTDIGGNQQNHLAQMKALSAEIRKFIFNGLEHVPKNAKQKETMALLLEPLKTSQPNEVINELFSNGYINALEDFLKQVPIEKVNLPQVIDLFKNAPNFAMFKAFAPLYEHIPIEDFLIALETIGAKHNAFSDPEAYADFESFLCDLEEVPGRLAEGRLTLNLLSKYPLTNFKGYFQKLNSFLIG